jgi:phospholipase/carboxylesterase
MSNQQRAWTHSIQQIGSLKTAIIHPNDLAKAREVFVMCHGFGAPGDDLVGIAQFMISQLRIQDRLPILVFPEAPIDLGKFGMPGGRAWWPLNMARLMHLAEKNDFSEMRNEVPPGIDEARNMLTETTERILEQFSLDTSALTIGGFSQGAMLATDTAIMGLKSPPKRLAVLSGALICESHWRSGADRLKSTEVVQTHGRFDTILPIQTGRWLNALLRENCREMNYHEFDGPHSIPPEAIEMLCRKSAADRT